MVKKEKVFASDQRSISDGQVPRDIPSLLLGSGSASIETFRRVPEGAEKSGAEDKVEERQKSDTAADSNATDGWLDLTDDAAGAITMQDGTEIDFTGIEYSQW